MILQSPQTLFYQETFKIVYVGRHLQGQLKKGKKEICLLHANLIELNEILIAMNAALANESCFFQCRVGIFYVNEGAITFGMYQSDAACGKRGFANE